MSLARRMVRNVFSSYASYFVVMAVAFFMRPFLIRNLGDAEYGIWILITSLTGYLGLMDLGIRSSLVKFVAQHAGEGDDQSLNRAISTGFVVNMALGTVAVLVAVMMMPLLGTFFGEDIPPEMLGRARTALLIVGFQMAISLPLSVFAQTIAGFQRYEITNGVRVCVTLLQALAIAIFVSRGYKILSLALVTLGARSLEFLVAGLIVRSNWKQVRIRPGLFSLSSARVLLPYSIWVFVFSIEGQIIYMTDAAVVSRVGSIGYVTVYSNAAVLIAYLRELTFCMSNVFCPTISHLEARGEMERMRRLWLRGSRYLALLIFPAAMGLVLYGKHFLALWLGEEYAVTGYPILLILLTHAFFSFPQYVSGAVMYGLNRHKWPAIVGLMNAMLNLVLSLWWGHLYGLIGVAAGTAVPVTLSALLFSPRFFCRQMKVPVRRYLGESFLRPALALIPMVVVATPLVLFISPGNWSTFLLQVFVTSGVYLFSLWGIGLENREREAIWAKVRRKSPEESSGCER